MDFIINNLADSPPEQAILNISIKTPDTATITYVSKTIMLL